jgi:hypothetical protein
MAESSPGTLDDILHQSLAGDGATAWRISRLVAAHHLGRAVLDGITGPFDLIEYASEGQCQASLAPGAHAQMSTHWSRAHGLSIQPVNAVYDVLGESTRCASSWRRGSRDTRRHTQRSS